jgi:hypothetical protein
MPLRFSLHPHRLGQCSQPLMPRCRHPFRSVAPQVRMVPQRPGIAFVEYEDEAQAGVAMQGLQGFKLATGVPLPLMLTCQPHAACQHDFA